MMHSTMQTVAVALAFCGFAGGAALGCSETGGVNEPRPANEASVPATVATASPSSTADSSTSARLGANRPSALDGLEMLGRTMPEWQLEQWNNGDPTTLAGLRGRVVVVRFWTAPDCPFCEKTLPALEALSEELAGEPVTFIGAFHSKPVAAHRACASGASLPPER